jgi:hypothetical protein
LLSVMTMGLTAAHRSGTLRHRRCRIRAASSCRAAEYGHTASLAVRMRAVSCKFEGEAYADR